MEWASARPSAVRIKRTPENSSRVSARLIGLAYSGYGNDSCIFDPQWSRRGDGAATGYHEPETQEGRASREACRRHSVAGDDYEF